MSNGTRNSLEIQPAHDALQKLLQDIKAVGVENLPSRPGTSVPNAKAWVQSLERTSNMLREWCDGFRLELPTKK